MSMVDSDPSIRESNASSSTCALCSSQEVQGRLIYSDYRYWNVLYARAPVEEGHFILAPIRHVKAPDHLSHEEVVAHQEVLRRCSNVANQLYRTSNKPYLLHADVNLESQHYFEQFVPYAPELKKVTLYNLLFDSGKKDLSDEELAVVTGPSKGCFQQAAHETFVNEQCDVFVRALNYSPIMKFAVAWRLELLTELTGSHQGLLYRIKEINDLVSASSFVGKAEISNPKEFWEKCAQVDQVLRSSVWCRELPYVQGRDRLTFISPHIFNHVVLSDGTSMNASHIKFPDEGQPYSAAETFVYAMSAPMPSFILQTLRMYAQEGAKYVVNVTDFEEESPHGETAIKAHRYLPDEVGGEVTGAGYSIRATAIRETPLSETLVLEEKDCTYEVDGQTHSITQFHLKGWVDNTPGDPEAIAHVIEKVLAFGGPGFVHCSAGIGRTGVFVGGLQILKQMQQGIVPDIEKIAIQMRTQRAHLGGSPAQYEVLWDLKAVFESKLQAASSTNDQSIEE